MTFMLKIPRCTIFITINATTTTSTFLRFYKTASGITCVYSSSCGSLIIFYLLFGWKFTLWIFSVRILLLMCMHSTILLLHLPLFIWRIILKSLRLYALAWNAISIVIFILMDIRKLSTDYFLKTVFFIWTKHIWIIFIII